MKYLTKLLFVFVIAWAPHASAQQITARYYPEKSQYMVGEPIVIVFEIVNKSLNAIEIGESGCPGFHEFEVDNASPKRTIALYGCGRKPINIDCLVGSVETPAGGKYRKRVLLEGDFELSSPGNYHIRAKREQSIHSKDKYGLIANLKVASEFDVHLRPPKQGELEIAYKPFLHDLRNRDIIVQSFAASAVTQNPPLFAEGAILALAIDPVIPTASIEALKRLATPISRSKLLEMASTTFPEYVRQPAIQALGEIGNPQDCQAMLAIASENKNYTQAEAYIIAGRICKEIAIPALNRLVTTNDSQLLLGIAGGFANTSSRLAVPPLITLLQNSDRSARQAAVDGLATLTRRTSKLGVEDEDSAKQSYIEWSGWWSVNSSTAPMYSSDQCSAPSPIT